jgi:hypothetical protein
MLPRSTGVGLGCAALLLTAAGESVTADATMKPPLQPVVEAEEDVYTYESPNNGSGPLWCSGSTCLARIGDEVFASGLETLKDVKPLNNCRWTLFKRGANGWQLAQADEYGRTREPSPLAGFPDGRLFLSVNPTLSTAQSGGGPARPEILEFSAKAPNAAFGRLLPGWEGNPAFSEHSYRSFIADGPRHELLLFQNIGYTHAEWAFRDRAGKWAAHGKLRWPYGAEYPKPEPIRVCYPDVALRHRAVHFCGVSDVVEPYPEWRAFKKQLTGNEWDYDFRRLFYTWTPDITRKPFSEWVEVASRDKTCGWISPGDLWVGPNGDAHIVWTERALDERLHAKFFPDAKQSHSLNYAVMRKGKIIFRRTLLAAEDGKSNEVPGAPRFQVTPDHRLFLMCYVQGTDATGKAVSENRLTEIYRGGELSPWVRVPFQKPFVSYFTATVRAGSAPSKTVDILGQQQGKSLTMSYGRVRLW